MARLATSHACVDRRAPVISRVVSRVYRSGLLWATVTGLLVTLVLTVMVRPRVPTAFSGLAGTVVAVAFICSTGAAPGFSALDCSSSKLVFWAALGLWYPSTALGLFRFHVH